MNNPRTPRFDRAFDRFIRNTEPKINPKTFFEVLAEIERERSRDSSCELLTRFLFDAGAEELGGLGDGAAGGGAEQDVGLGGIA